MSNVIPHLNDLLFAHWLCRKVQIQAGNGGMWRGNSHPEPILLHSLIDDELDSRRATRDVNRQLWVSATWYARQ